MKLCTTNGMAAILDSSILPPIEFYQIFIDDSELKKIKLMQFVAGLFIFLMNYGGQLASRVQCGNSRYWAWRYRLK